MFGVFHHASSFLFQVLTDLPQTADALGVVENLNHDGIVGELQEERVLSEESCFLEGSDKLGGAFEKPHLWLENLVVDIEELIELHLDNGFVEAILKHIIFGSALLKEHSKSIYSLLYSLDCCLIADILTHPHEVALDELLHLRFFLLPLVVTDKDGLDLLLLIFLIGQQDLPAQVPSQLPPLHVVPQIHRFHQQFRDAFQADLDRTGLNNFAQVAELFPRKDLTQKFRSFP